MAIKSTLFLMALVLLAMRMDSSVEAVQAPTHPPPKAPYHAPPPPFFHHTHYSVCVPKCETHCKGKRPVKLCMKECTACCAKYKCVPDKSKQYCKNWADGVVIRGKMVKCPA